MVGEGAYWVQPSPAKLTSVVQLLGSEAAGRGVWRMSRARPAWTMRLAAPAIMAEPARVRDVPRDDVEDAATEVLFAGSGSIG
jgi:hypothetical protein